MVIAPEVVGSSPLHFFYYFSHILIGTNLTFATLRTQYIVN